MNVVYRYRVKSHLGELNRQARVVNLVWNYCNDIQRQAVGWGRRWLSGFDLNYLTAGACRELGVLSATVNAVCERYAESRSKARRPWLRYRSSRRSLGWIPVKATSLRQNGDSFRFNGRHFKVFNARLLPGRIRDGSSFARDALGNWFLNVVVEIPEGQPRGVIAGVGIDIGLKEFAALSTGEKIAAPQHFRRAVSRVATFQRARKKRAVAKAHARVANARRDFLHKLSTRIVRKFDYIAVGNVKPAPLKKTRMAKSISDAGWTSFRNMLRYKAIAHGAKFEEVDESFSSQVCSACGCLPASRPKGIADLGIRGWTCSDCGAVHDRDVNAARNILRSGRRAPVVGIAA